MKRIEFRADIIRMTETILEQNGRILEMNAKLLAAFNSPGFVVEPAPLSDDQIKEMLKPGPTRYGY